MKNKAISYIWNITRSTAKRFSVSFLIFLIPVYFFTNHLFGDRVGMGYAVEATAVLSLYVAFLLPVIIWFICRLFALFIRILRFLKIIQPKEETVS